MHKHIMVATGGSLIPDNVVSSVIALVKGLAAKLSTVTVTKPYQAVKFTETMTNVDRGDNKMRFEEPIAPDRSAIDKFVAALVRIRGVDRLDDAVITRHWLPTDMRVTIEDLDCLLKLLRQQGLIGLPNDHLVKVLDGAALKEIALRSR